MKKSEFRPGRHGLQFKNGKLYEFTPTYVLVMKGWPDPRAWFKRRSHGWRPTRKLADDEFSQIDFFDTVPAPEKPASLSLPPDGQMTLPGMNLLTFDEWYARTKYLKYLARSAFIDMIPGEIRQELQRYSSRRWQVMGLFARCPGAMDLSHSNSALLFALANNWAFHKPAVKQPIRAARALVWRKQKVIQEWLGFPATEPVRRLLAKIEPSALDMELLFFLRDALRDPLCLNLLSHLPTLSREVAMLASDLRTMPHVTPRLLEEILHTRESVVVGANGRPKDPYKFTLDTVRMAQIVNWERCPRLFHNAKRVFELHDELAEKMDADRVGSYFKLPERFADPPFPGTEHITPLTTPAEMFEEGQIQQNCLGAHVPMVARGVEYVYRVEQPVRATLSVVRRAGDWVLGEFFKARNEPIDRDTTRQVLSSLLQNRGSAIVAAP